MAVSTNLIQIEEFELAAGTTDIVYTTTSGLDNSLIGIYNDHYGVYPANVAIEGSGVQQRLHITYDTQTFNMNVAVLFLKGDLTINNTLTSNSETDALSAKQGKVLKDLIDNIQVTGALSDLDDVDLTSLAGGDILVYDGINQKWINMALPTIPTDINDLDDVIITSPSNGQALVYDNGDWINGNVSGSSSDDYTLTETRIGTYLGKPLYRVCLPTISFDNNYTYTHNLGVKYYVNIGGTCTAAGGTNPLPFPFVQSRYSGFLNVQNATNNTLIFDSSWNGNTVNCYIDYTKESDYT